MKKKKSGTLSSKHTEEIRRDIEFDLHELMGDFISATRAAHSAMRVGAMNLKYVRALGPEIETIADVLREASENLRKIQAGVETLAHRAKEGKL